MKRQYNFSKVCCVNIEQIVFLLVGSNLGDKLNFLLLAQNKIEENIGNIIAISSVYESESWGFKTNNTFLNQCVEVKTKLSPDTILKKIHIIEKSTGRVHNNKNNYESRNLDIDILFYNNDIIKKSDLIIPHPKLQERRFCLLPLVEIAPQLRHPTLKKTISQLLDECEDKANINKSSLKCNIILSQ